MKPLAHTLQICIAILLIMVLPQTVFSQAQGNIWYFGNEAGIDFNSGSPVALTNSVMSTYEGCSSISDENGRLLFYTDGITIYNANHTQMANGGGLLGDPSASQSGVIVKVPGTFGRYFIFSVDDDAGPSGLRYSIVDMSLQGGLGAVTIKNIPLETPVTEKITAVAHRNGRDVWVLAHGWGNNTFHAFLVTSAGILPPVLSNSGTSHAGPLSNSRGCMKASPNGQLLAVAITGSSLVELFEFDDSLGVVSNPIGIPNVFGAFGVEFSVTGKFMYVSSADITPGELFQFRVDLLSPAAINASKTFIAKTASISLGALQMGPDRRIYCSRFGGTSLGVIEFPDTAGIGCSYIDNGFYLATKRAQLGLPNFVQSFFLPPEAGFNYTSPCLGDSTLFSGRSSVDSVSWLWDFGDPASGPNNSSTQQIVRHLYNSPGVYPVTLIVSKDSVADTITYMVEVYDYPSINIGPSDTIICDQPDYTLNGGTANFYLWSTGETTPSITVNQDGLYYIEAGNGPCRVSDSINVDFRPRPYVDLGLDKKLCRGDGTVLNGSNPGGDFLWSTGETSQIITPQVSGLYWVRVTTGACVERDSVYLTVISPPEVDLGNDRSYCLDRLRLSTQGAESITWSTGETSAEIFANNTGLYWVELQNDICFARDSVFITLFDPVRIDLGRNLVVCRLENDSILLDATIDGGNYAWSTGASTPQIWVKEPGIYSVSAISQAGCEGSAQTEIEEDCPPAVFVPTAFTPNGDDLNDQFSIVTQNVSAFSVRIFDRWGNLIYESNDPAFQWVGDFGGQACPEGNYTWQVVYTTAEGNPVNQAGVLTLIR